MRISYINLDRDEARRSALEAQLNKIGLSASRIAALTPADLDPDLIAENCDPTRNNHVAPVELACTMSHRKAWRTMLDSDASFALFLEDDVLISPRLGEFLDAVPPLLDDLDILRVETCRPIVSLGPVVTQIDGLSEFHRPHSFNYGAGGYILTRPGAERLAVTFFRPDLTVDYVMYSPQAPAFGTLRVLQSVPAPVANGEVMATLTGTQMPSNLVEGRESRLKFLRARRNLKTPAGLQQVLFSLVRALRGPVENAVNATFHGARKMEIPFL